VTSPTIRPATLADLDALVALEAAAFATDRMERRSFRHAVRSASTDLFVAAEGERLVGYAALERRRGARAARLTSIAVLPAAAGRGLGRRLLMAAEAAALQGGAGMLRLEVRADNAAAQRLYETAGYRRTATVEDYYEDGEAAWRYERALDTVTTVRGADQPQSRERSRSKASTSPRSSTKRRAP
jgi:[ribosomal protein S18]-alanine N-acetyltransferase